VPEAVVHGFEPVHVDDEERKGLAEAPRVVGRPPEPLEEHARVDEASQRVALREQAVQIPPRAQVVGASADDEARRAENKTGPDELVDVEEAVLRELAGERGASRGPEGECAERGSEPEERADRGVESREAGAGTRCGALGRLRKRGCGVDRGRATGRGSGLERCVCRNTIVSPSSHGGVILENL